jgi:dTMP kinase
LHPDHPLAVSCEALLFMASRAQMIVDVIRPALDAGHAVVSDRFLLANIAYQGYAGGLPVDELWEIGRFATGGIEPDLTMVLDLPVTSALARRKKAADRVESRDLDYHERVRAGFLEEAARRPDKIRVVEADRPVDAVHEAVWREVVPLLEQRERE